MGSHQEESPNSCKAPNPNTRSRACANVRARTHIYAHSILLFSSLCRTHTHTHLHIHFSSWYALWPGLVKRGQLSRCSATAFTIGTSNWWRQNRKRSTNVLHSSCTVESARWATHNTCFILGSFESALIHCVKQCGGIRLYISAVSSNWVKKKKQ